MYTVSCVTVQNISLGVKKKKSVEKDAPLLGISGCSQMSPVDRGMGDIPAMPLLWAVAQILMKSL